MIYNYQYLRGVLVALLLLPGFVFASGVGTKGLLWKVENKNTKASYLFGTMHTEDSRIILLPVPVKEVFDSARSFTSEVKLDATVALDVLSIMTLADNQSLKTILGESLYSKSYELLADYGMMELLVNRLKPWAVFVTLSTPLSKTGQFLDKVLYDRAVEQGKSTYALETVQEQLAIFNDMPMSEQIILLEDTLKNHDKFPAMFEEMANTYLARDLDALVVLNDKYMQDGDTKITEKLMKRLLVDRNVRMVDRMAKQLKEGNAFIAVGALHLPGKDGLLSLLRSKGYKISAAY